MIVILVQIDKSTGAGTTRNSVGIAEKIISRGAGGDHSIRHGGRRLCMFEEARETVIRTKSKHMKIVRSKRVRSVGRKTARYQPHEAQLSLPTCSGERVKPTV